MKKKSEKSFVVILFFVCFLLISVCSADGSPIEFGHTVSGTIEQGGQTVNYTFTAQSGDTVLARIKKSTNDSPDPVFWIYAPNGTFMGSNAGQYSELVTVLPDTGTYTLVVGSSSTTVSTYYSLFVQRTNNPSAFEIVESGRTVTAAIDATAEMDTYRLTAQAGDGIIVRMTGSWESSALGCMVEVYAPNGSLLAQSPLITQGKPEGNVHLQAPVSGQYTILVGGNPWTWCCDPWPYTGTYSFLVQNSGTQGSAVALEYGSTHTGELNLTGGMVKAYIFTAQSGDTVLARIKKSTNDSPDPVFWIYAPNGTFMGSNAGQYSELVTALPDTGTYTLVVGSSSTTVSTYYSLFVQRTNNPSAFEIVESGRTVTAAIDATAEMDTYRLTAQAGDGIIVRMTGSWESSALGCMVEVYAPNGSLLAQSPLITQGKPEGNVHLQAPVSGQYTILVGGNPWTWCCDPWPYTGTYSFLVQNSGTQGSAVALEYGSTHTGELNLTGGMVKAYIFTAQSGDTVLARIKKSTNDSPDPVFWIYAPNGTFMGSNAGQYSELVTVLPDTGTYTLVVGSSSTTVSTYYSLFVQRTNNPSAFEIVESGRTVTAAIDATAEMDTYRLTAQAGDGIIVRMTGSWESSALGCMVEVYAPNGSLLAQSPLITQGKPEGNVHLQAPVSGQYTILVGGNPWTWCCDPWPYTGTYSFLVQNSGTQGSAVALEYGSTHTGELNLTGGMVKAYIFTAQSGDTVLARIKKSTNDSPDPVFWIYAPNGTFIGSGGELQIILPDGNYTLVVGTTSTTVATHFSLYLSIIGPLGDLIPSGISFNPQVDNIEGLNVSWTGNNGGYGPIAGTWLDAIYLSKDGELDLADIKLCSETQQLVLRPGQNYSVTTILHPVSVIQNGTYYMILKTDDLNSVNESKEWNNLIINPLKIGSDGAFTELASHQSAITADLRQQKVSVTQGTVDGDLSGSWNLTPFEIVTVTSGPFKGQGFFNGIITSKLDTIEYSGNLKGVIVPDPGNDKLQLKGTISGTEMSGLFEGTLTESLPGSGVYDQFLAVWKLNRIQGDITSTRLQVDGNLSMINEHTYSAVPLTVIQTSMGGATFGDYEENISTVLTHLHIADPSIPFNGKGFSTLSYNSAIGQGTGWTYDSENAPDFIDMKGSFTSPLESVGSGTLTTNTPRSLSIGLERIDLGLPALPDLEVSISGPQGLSPGQTVNYLIEVRNEGVATANDVLVAASIPSDMEIISNSNGGKYIWETHEVFWKLGTLPPRSIHYLSYKVNAKWGLPAGTRLRNNVRVGTKSGEIDIYQTSIPSFSNIDAYLNYEPRSVVSIKKLSPHEIATERLDPEFSDIWNYTLELGAVYTNTSLEYQYNNEMTMVSAFMIKDDHIYIVSKTKKLNEPNISVIIQPGDDFTLYFDRIGGISLNMTTGVIQSVGNSWPWQNIACANNCLTTAISGLIKPVGWAQLYNNCRRAYNPNDNGAAFQDCLEDAAGQAHPVVSPILCIGDCMVNPEKHTCPTCNWREYCSDSPPGSISQSHCNDYLWTYFDIKMEHFKIKQFFDIFEETCICQDSTGKNIGPVTLWDKPAIGTICKAVPKDQVPNSDDQNSDITPARDPNIKYGPEGHVLAGQTLDYRIEYENVGDGIAFGVYFIDTLDANLDDSTLSISPVYSTVDNSVIAPAGTFNPGTRTITWLVGEVSSHEGGYANISVNVRSDAPDDTEIINHGTVYFPSVPEETKTNAIVSVVGINHPPDIPISPFPAEDGTNIPITTVLLWTGSDPDLDSLRYDIFFGNDNPPLLVERDSFSTVYDPRMLENDTTYYWQVVARDPDGLETASPIWNFTTKSAQPSVIPLPGFTNPPTDPDSDGLYEDLNTNGFADWDDAVVLFWNTDWIQENEPVSAFDFNGNGFIDWDDAVVLFWEV